MKRTSHSGRWTRWMRWLLARFLRRPLGAHRTGTYKPFFEAFDRREAPTGMSVQSALGLAALDAGLMQTTGVDVTLVQRPTPLGTDQDTGDSFNRLLAGTVGVGTSAPLGGGGGGGPTLTADAVQTPSSSESGTDVFGPFLPGRF